MCVQGLVRLRFVASIFDILRRLLLPLLLAALVAPPTAGAARPFAPVAARVQVIVELDAPPAAVGASRGTGSRAVAAVSRAQAAFERRLADAAPTARVGWRYELVLAGMSLSLPTHEVEALAALPGVAAVYPSVRYRALLDESPAQIGAPELWGAGLEHAGQGIRIGIIDDGIDAGHPFFSPAGFTAPAGFPRGPAADTSARVIVARAFPPKGAAWQHAGAPFDPVYSRHGTHVAGIAAGGPTADSADTYSGVAPKAFLGNYKALTIPTDSFGLDGNSPEIVAAIEAAVADGMDVINLSIGEPEITPARDAVARALANAAAAGVVPVVAAGNEYAEQGNGSVGSPGSAPAAITVGAVNGQGVIASFSAAGPSTRGLAAKPDVTAPGVSIASAVPGSDFGTFSGTSMAAPHVAGGVALLLGLHPSWTPAQVKSALTSTGKPVWATSAKATQASSTRQGGGLVDLPAASTPLVFASPSSLGFGLLDVSDGAAEAVTTVELADAGGGAGLWAVTVELQQSASGASISVPATATVPGNLPVEVTAAAGATEGERSGFVVLRRNGEARRIPFWLRVVRPELDRHRATTLRKPGRYAGDLRRGRAIVERYRYPESPAGIPIVLAGPEQVFRVSIPAGTANFGVAVVAQTARARIEPRIVVGADENRLAGIPVLPLVTNPYLDRFGERIRTSAVLLPGAGTYSLVFDSVSRAAAGAFAFRLWVNDVSRPTARLLSTTATRGQLRVRVADGGSGVDPSGIRFTLDGRQWRAGRLSKDGRTAILPLAGVASGSHSLVVRIADRQEAKNDENVASILPNTRELRATIHVP